MKGEQQTHSATTRPCVQVMYCHGLAPQGAAPAHELNLAFVAARFSANSAAAACRGWHMISPATVMLEAGLKNASCGRQPSCTPRIHYFALRTVSGGAASCLSGGALQTHDREHKRQQCPPC